MPTAGNLASSPSSVWLAKSATNARYVAERLLMAPNAYAMLARSISAGVSFLSKTRPEGLERHVPTTKQAIGLPQVRGLNLC